LRLANHDRTKMELNMAIQDYISLIGSKVTFLDKTDHLHVKREGVFQGVALVSKDLRDLEFFVDDIAYQLSKIEFI
ncbi:hypothetical protein R0K20_19435, partial [Staphylococcus sp. SIMBA_130]